MFNCELEKHKEPRPFEARLEAYLFNEVMIARTRSNAAFYNRNARDARVDGVDMIMLQLFLRGEVQFESENTTTYGNTGDIVVFDLTREIKNFNTDFEHISVLFPRYMLEEHFPHIGLWHGLVLPQSNPMTELLKRHIIALHDMGAQTHVSSASFLQKSLLELTLGCVTENTNQLSERLPCLDTCLLMEIKRFIRGNIKDPNLNSDSIALNFGISRAQLYRIAEPLDGVMNYIRELRLNAIYRELKSTSSKNISEIAYLWGFTDFGTFSRNFKKRFNMTAKEARHSTSTIAKGIDTFDSSSVDRKYESWLKALGE